MSDVVNRNGLGVIDGDGTRELGAAFERPVDAMPLKVVAEVNPFFVRRLRDLNDFLLFETPTLATIAVGKNIAAPFNLPAHQLQNLSHIKANNDISPNIRASLYEIEMEFEKLKGAHSHSFVLLINPTDQTLKTFALPSTHETAIATVANSLQEHRGFEFAMMLDLQGDFSSQLPSNFYQYFRDFNSLVTKPVISESIIPEQIMPEEMAGIFREMNTRGSVPSNAERDVMKRIEQVMRHG